MNERGPDPPPEQIEHDVAESSDNAGLMVHLPEFHFPVFSLPVCSFRVFMATP